MTSNIKILITLACIIFSGCATQPMLYVPLPAESSAPMRASTVFFATQNSLSVNIGNSNVSKSSGYMFGGLLAAAIDVSVNGFRQTSADNQAKVLKTEWGKYGLNSAIREKLDTKLTEISWLHVIDFKDHIENENNATLPIAEFFSKASTDTIAVIRTYSYLHEDADSITTKLTIDIHTKDEHGKLAKEPIYKNTLFSQYSLPGSMPGKKTSLSSWSENDNQHLRAAFDEGVERITRRLISGLDHPQRKGWEN